MKNSRKKITLWVSALIALAACFAGAFFYIKTDRVLNESCSAVMQVHDSHAGFAASMNSVLVLSPERYGYMDMTGKMTFQGNTFTVSREIKFNYRHEGEDIFRITNLSISRHATDTAPDQLMDNGFFSMSNEDVRYMTVNRFRNALLIGNLQSPSFMCVIR